ncbi:NAD-binding protein [Streptomyces purpurogeneiscleroticus]|uniref:NAD-binding protein n=1 Tax=Streptomyces purpurogeneiscleroticus TaxID=68259 RepID=UPI001CC1227D|nr:NAD-binding protein [Streptomyces purpurogeneiscleroticus]MBZ4018838.1 potassium transporter TrkA [Streptomyces purpurogeneiscleroticus]
MLGDVSSLSPVPQQSQPTPPTPHMVVCGDDSLAHRLAVELREVYREQVTLVVPSVRDPRGPRVPQPARGGLGRAGAFLGRMTAAVGRGSAPDDTRPADGPGAPDAEEEAGPVRVLEAPEPDDETLTEAGVEEAGALALVYDDDETNIHAALRARRMNPRLRLVIRLYNRRLGQHLEELLDQAAAVVWSDPSDIDASTTVLSDADTVAPALTATAVAGTSKVIEVDGLLLRAVEHTPGAPSPPRAAGRGLATLALLSPSASDDTAHEGGPAPAPPPPGGRSRHGGRTAHRRAADDDGPTLLPDDATAAAAAGRATIELETVSYRGRRPSARRLVGRGAPLGSLFSPRLRWSIAGLVGTVLTLAVVSTLTTGDDPLHAAYLSLLDLFAINEPAIDEGPARKVLQLLSGLTGLLLLPVLVAAALEAFGTFRSAASLRRPPRGLSGHVVLLGLGKVGTRVLARLRELGVPVVCVEEDPEARGIPLARRLRVPTVLGDATEDGVLEAAGIARARTLLALTSEDSTNLEASLYARSVKPQLRVTLRLFDDRFATAVYRTLRAAHPTAVTRSRSVSFLAAPAFAGAMMGRQILGAVPVERRLLLVAHVDVRGQTELVGRRADQVFRAGRLRLVAVNIGAAPDPAEDPETMPGPGGQRWEPARLVRDLPPGYVLRPQDRVVIAATREGLGELLGRRPGPAVSPQSGSAGTRQG